MSDDDKLIKRPKGKSKKSWLWTILAVVGGGICLIVLLGLTAFLIKWGIIALLVYGAFALARRLLTKPAKSDSAESKLLPEGDSQPDTLAMLEQDRQLDKLKARMSESSHDSRN